MSFAPAHNQDPSADDVPIYQPTMNRILYFNAQTQTATLSAVEASTQTEQASQAGEHALRLPPMLSNPQRRQTLPHFQRIYQTTFAPQDSPFPAKWDAPLEDITNLPSKPSATKREFPWQREINDIKRLCRENNKTQLWLYFHQLGTMRSSEKMLLERKITGCHYWDITKQCEEVYWWVRRRKYNRNWNTVQKEGFKELLLTMEQGAQKVLFDILFARHDLESLEDAEKVAEKMLQQFRVHLDKYQITNIAILSSGPVAYRFLPVGEDQPKYSRSSFVLAEECAYVKWLGPQYWADNADQPAGGVGSSPKDRRLPLSLDDYNQCMELSQFDTKMVLDETKKGLRCLALSSDMSKGTEYEFWG